MEKDNGKLYIVPTPIGNLEDITLRALRVLKEADIILCEDTRQSIKLLNHYEISNKLVSYHEHNEMERSQEVISMIYEGKNIALISDAGTPGISDPGHVIICKCIEHNIDFTVLPGASATITGLVLSGLENDSFRFMGFFPRETKNQKYFINQLESADYTTIIYESVHRIRKTLSTLAKIFPNRKIAVMREITKIHEEAIRGSLEEVARIYEDKTNVKGEFVIVLEKGVAPTIEKSIGELLQEELDKGKTKKAAIKNVVEQYGFKKNEVYEECLKL